MYACMCVKIYINLIHHPAVYTSYNITAHTVTGARDLAGKCDVMV